MKDHFKIGVLKETKTPPDRRVALPPTQVKQLMERYPNIQVVVQPSDYRCYRNDEYEALGIPLVEDVSDCDLLLGVKEVKIEALIPNKTYLFFSHVAKKQHHNQPLIKAMANKGITLLDHEYLTDKNNVRLVAFGRWAGIVGAYNCLRAKGIRTDYFSLKPAHHCHDKNELFEQLKPIRLRPIKLLITGGGRVANGALETFRALNIKEVSPEDFLTKTYDEAVLTRLDPWHYVKRKDGKEFDWKHFSDFPAEYESTFLPYTKVTNLFVACHFWDFRSPHFFTAEDMRSPDFKISVIADVSCDVGGPIPSTLRATTIAEPFFGYNPITEKEEVAFTSKKNITIMSVDNLPGELPRDASEDFGNALVEKVLPCYVTDDCDEVLQRATILENGKLTERYKYLTDYLTGNV